MRYQLHGGTDEHPVHIDLSTNGNAFGPSPMAKAALHTQIHNYPDPLYLSVRQSIAAHRPFEVDEIVIGAGATELIHRIVEVFGGPIVFQSPGFSEYKLAALRYGVETRSVPGDPYIPDLEAMRKAMTGAKVAFITQPGNPDAMIRPPDWCEKLAEISIATGCLIVWDLAYIHMTPVADVMRAAPRNVNSIHLFAPNKPHGCTGLRAGWLAASPELAQQLRDAQLSWVVSTPSASFLQEAITPAGDMWVDETVSALLEFADDLATDLQGLGLNVHHADTTFVLVQLPNASEMAIRLREAYSIKVRDATSLGLPGWWRVCASPPEKQNVFLDSLEHILFEAE